ncbi:hypothetical protein [Antrihabitans stalactiti]|uniref:Uncharacterized protein n=1 Tax=Antrihabitans stalactiti TaxID=2584121 RepID=A0A848KQ84_9NOCA|nr:hypothetical protein [Antrihabitans stalactiti]NMN98440.1 hypothetical protein [Antrihabitans stalactiti]
MRVTSINQLAVTLRLPPSSLAELRDLSLDDVARLTGLIDQAKETHRSQMQQAMDKAMGFLPVGRIYKFATRGRR